MLTRQNHLQKLRDEDSLSKMPQMTYTLALSVLIAFKGTNIHILYTFIRFIDQKQVTLVMMFSALVL